MIMAKLGVRVFAAATVILCAMVAGSSAQDTLDTLQDKLSQALWLGRSLLLEKGILEVCIDNYDCEKNNYIII